MGREGSWKEYCWGEYWWMTFWKNKFKSSEESSKSVTAAAFDSDDEVLSACCKNYLSFFHQQFFLEHYSNKLAQKKRSSPLTYYVFFTKCPFKLFQILLCVILFWTGKIDSRSVVPWQGCRNLQVSRIKRYLVCLTQGIELVYIWCPCVNEFLFIVIYLLIFVFQSCSIGKQQCPAQLNFARWFLQGIRQLWTSLICYWPNMLECWSDYKEFCAVETYPSSSLLLQSSLISWLSQSV